MDKKNDFNQSLDVETLIIGAGIAGISAAYHLKKNRPNSSFLILEGREQIGGIWSFFRYPGIRSDSDMQSFAFGFKPWTQNKTFGSAQMICDYLQETITENGIDKHIQFGSYVTSAEFSSDEGLWTVKVKQKDQKNLVTLRSRFLLMGTGYYDYNNGYTPEFKGIEEFKGQIVHPQHWPKNLNYSGKKVVVIGSGATAVTLIPAMANDVGHITMLQRSPSYVIAMPSVDPIAVALNKVLSPQRAYEIIRKKNIALSRGVFNLSRRFPDVMRRLLIADVRRRLPKGFDVDTHFSPKYNPWDERLCVVPDGDMFKAISAGKASVVTDHIERFTKEGILLKSGKVLEADIIITATGLNMLAFSKIQLTVDGKNINYPDTTIYKSMMLSDIPNFAFAFGYTNIAWTLKVDLVWKHFCHMLDYMDENKYGTFTPVIHNKDMKRVPFVDLSPGYVQRGLAQFPMAGTEGNWTLQHDYKFDLERLTNDSVVDKALQFTDIRPKKKLTVVTESSSEQLKIKA
ncbi:flavin-containing monooxygenase [Acinetobacter colistiniresistens]|uniref:flavin-containing monooxygenase n=1 Tax=Acinetobacter colistiniresistens TaxID=280145 RepID=UPI000DCFA762|nr:NAD(P)/FAD-dependent oxidoreductase [Acinetobacter colistiniresistens]